jgi:hypothetical protein
MGRGLFAECELSDWGECLGEAEEYWKRMKRGRLSLNVKVRFCEIFSLRTASFVCFCEPFEGRSKEIQLELVKLGVRYRWEVRL